MIVDPQLTRSQWPVGKVSELLSTSDKRIRAVWVKVGSQSYERPVARLVKLAKCNEVASEGKVLRIQEKPSFILVAWLTTKLKTAQR